MKPKRHTPLSHGPWRVTDDGELVLDVPSPAAPVAEAPVEPDPSTKPASPRRRQVTEE